MGADTSLTHTHRAMGREIVLLCALTVSVLAEPPVSQGVYGAPGAGLSSGGGYSPAGGYSAGGGYSSTGGYSSSGSYTSSGYPGGSQVGGLGSGFGGNGYSSGREVARFTHEQDFRRDPGVIWGKWTVALPDGRLQTVEYDADETGFHPTVTFDEPNGAGGFGTGGGYNY